MTRQSGSMACGMAVTLGLVFAAVPALAQEMTSKIDGGATAWMISATALVLLMTIPGLALFYAGMVRKKNILATMAQSLAVCALVSLLWFAIGYSLAFMPGSEFLGDTSARWLQTLYFHKGEAKLSVHSLANTIPESVFVMFQL